MIHDAQKEFRVGRICFQRGRVICKLAPHTTLPHIIDGSSMYYYIQVQYEWNSRVEAAAAPGKRDSLLHPVLLASTFLPEQPQHEEQMLPAQQKGLQLKLAQLVFIRKFDMDQTNNIFQACQRRLERMETPSIEHGQVPSSSSLLKRKAMDNDLETSFRDAKRQLCEIQAKNSLVAPVEVAFRLFRENGFDVKDTDLEQQVPFTKPTSEMINGYQPEKTSLVRKKDIDGVRALHEEGESFDACNRFGESLIHIACRRGCKEMVEFLVRDVKVSLFIRDDYGECVG